MLGVVFHFLFAQESAAEQGKKVVLLMLATGGVFLCVIALGELAHWAGQRKQRRRD